MAFIIKKFEQRNGDMVYRQHWTFCGSCQVLMAKGHSQYRFCPFCGEPRGDDYNKDCDALPRFSGWCHETAKV